MEKLARDIIEMVIAKVAYSLATSNSIAGGVKDTKVTNPLHELKKSDQQTSRVMEDPSRPQDRTYSWAKKTNENDLRDKKIGTAAAPPTQSVAQYSSNRS